jgi:GAF domain-containing protein
MSNQIVSNPIPDQQKSFFSHQEWQEQFLRVIFYVACVFGLPVLISAALLNIDKVLTGIYIGLYIVLVFAAFLKLPYWLKAVILLSLLYALGLSGLAEAGILDDSRLFFLGFITLATLLFSLPAGIIATVISIVSIIMMGGLILSGQYQIISTTVMAGTLETWLTASLSFILLAVVIMSAINAIQREFRTARKRTNEYLQTLFDEQTGLEEKVEERTLELNQRSSQLEAAAQVARAAAEVHDLKELLDSVVRQITSRFGFYHAGIFLTDSTGQKVVLAAASSEGGQRMLARGHKLEVGHQGIVGFAAYQKRSRIAQDVGADEAFFNNPDLPDTHSEVALPLIVQNRLIGVLDIQSQEHNAFSLDDVYALQTMADQIAMAIENTRLIERSSSAIQELETISANAMKKAWKDRLGGQVRGFTYTTLGVDPIEKRKVSSKNSAGEKTIKVSLSLRGKEIGAISLQRKASDPTWTSTDKEMVERIAAQVVLAIENARLLEESQRNAEREQTVNELSSQFSHSLDVDTLLQNAVREIHRLPQVSEVSVFIKPVEETRNSE